MCWGLPLPLMHAFASLSSCTMLCRHEIAVIAALLHDVLDDTTTTPEALSAAFGPTVTAMVVSVSKLSAVNQMLRRDKRKVKTVRRSFWPHDGVIRHGMEAARRGLQLPGACGAHTHCAHQPRRCMGVVPCQADA
jgi:hypothetical protein